MYAFDLSDVQTIDREYTMPKTDLNHSTKKKTRTRSVRISEGSTRKWRMNDWPTITGLRKQVLKQAKEHNCDIDIIDSDGKIIYTAHPKDEV